MRAGALAVDAGRVVPLDRLIERVSGVDATQRSRATLHSYISRLRRALAGAAGDFDNITNSLRPSGC